MIDENRPYRKNLTSHGLIYLGGDELEISIRNLSITGVLAELEDNESIQDIQGVFKSVQATPMIDIYLPEMRLAGEANVVRADIVDGHIYLALEFRSVSYDVDNVLYKRKAYRKDMIAPGQIVFNKTKHHFFTKNVSVEGLMILIKETIDAEPGMTTIFDFPRLKLRGEIQVSWVEHLEDGSTLMGLHYIHMEKENIAGIPSFYQAIE